MGLFRRENLFCTICKKSISHKQKPQREWNLEGYVCGDCYVDEIKKQYELEEIKRKNYEKNGATLPKPKAKKSTRSIKFDFYLCVIMILVSSLIVISALTGDEQYGIIIGLPTLIIFLIQLPKRKKLFDELSENDNES